MNKEIISGGYATALIKNTVIKLCDYVALTLGPKGRNVIIDTDYTEPFITNDGVTIAKNLEFEFKEEAVAKIIKEASIKTCEKVGDGTTTSLVLLKSIYLESLKYVEQGISPFIIKEKLDEAVNSVCEKILLQSRKASLKTIGCIASISSGSNEVGLLIEECFKKVGFNGKILVEESTHDKTEVQIIDGMFLENGVVSSFLINDRMKEEVINNSYMLITDYKIESIEQIESILDKLKGKTVTLIAESFDEEIIEYLSSLKKNNIINITCIEAPNYSENKTDILEDICIYTNSKLISKKYGLDLESISLEDLGIAKKIRINRNNTVIYNEYNEKTKSRAEYITELLSKEDNEFDREILATRLANLTGGIAVIYAGAKTKSEMILNKMRIEDAICASKVTLDYGYSLGGGLSFYNISNKLEGDTLGNKILKESLKMPIKQIIINSGIDSKEVFKELKNKKEGVGFDALNNKYIDMEASGIIDPTHVLVESLRNASSIAGILLTTSLVIATKNKKEEKNISEVL